MANNWALSRGRTDKREAGLGWRDRLRRAAPRVPAAVAQRRAELKLRVVAALSLIFIGKLVNVALPMFYGWIVDALSMAHAPR